MYRIAHLESSRFLKVYFSNVDLCCLQVQITELIKKNESDVYVSPPRPNCFHGTVFLPDLGWRKDFFLAA